MRGHTKHPTMHSAAGGYPLERLERLKIVIERRHGGGQPVIKRRTTAFHLRGRARLLRARMS